MLKNDIEKTDTMMHLISAFPGFGGSRKSHLSYPLHIVKDAANLFLTVELTGVSVSVSVTFFKLTIKIRT